MSGVRTAAPGSTARGWTRRGSAPWLPRPEYMTLADGSRLLALLHLAQGECRVVQCLAARRGEGTSSVARDLALIAARRPDLRVLLLDLDPPGRHQAEVLRTTQDTLASAPSGQLLPGQVEAGSAAQLAVLRFGGAGLHVSEVHGAWPGAAVIWNGAIAVMRASFDLVVVDSASLQAGFDGVMLAPQMDANLIVLEAESTRVAVAQNLRDQLLEVGAPIAGVVLNRRRFHIPGFIYSQI
jgi:succinoglycan biosynthesis transport protein ExoP